MKVGHDWVYKEWGDVRKATKGLEKIEDQSVLTSIVRTNPNRFMRAAAIGKVKAPELLLETARRDRSGLVRLVAISSGNLDEEALKNIAKNDKLWWVKNAALDKITDQDFIVEVAKSDENSRVRRKAALLIKSQDVLKEIARNDRINWVREAALQSITERAFLTNVANNDRSKWVRQDASLALEVLTMKDELSGT